MRNLVEKETERLPTTIPTSSEICTDDPGVCISTAQPPDGNAISVRVCYNHPLMIGLPGILPDPLLMCSKTTMRELP
jgi:hypothetical protein